MSENIPHCKNCDATGWVCENHADRPSNGESSRDDACGCGAGAPCRVCVPEGMAPWELYPIDPASIIFAVDGFAEHMEERRAVLLKGRH
jgi:hypothetical protein